MLLAAKTLCKQADLTYDQKQGTTMLTQLNIKQVPQHTTHNLVIQLVQQQEAHLSV